MRLRPGNTRKPVTLPCSVTACGRMTSPMSPGCSVIICRMRSMGWLRPTTAVEGGGALPATWRGRTSDSSCAIAIDYDPVGVDGVQLRAARDVVADREHLGGLCGLSEDCEPVLWIIAGDDSRQHQRHARLRRVRAILPRCRGGAEQVRIGDGGDVQRVRAAARAARRPRGTACPRRRRGR